VTLIVTNRLRHGTRAGCSTWPAPSPDSPHRRSRGYRPKLGDRVDGALVRCAAAHRRGLCKRSTLP